MVIDFFSSDEVEDEKGLCHFSKLGLLSLILFAGQWIEFCWTHVVIYVKHPTEGRSVSENIKN